MMIYHIIYDNIVNICHIVFNNILKTCQIIYDNLWHNSCSPPASHFTVMILVRRARSAAPAMGRLAKIIQTMNVIFIGPRSLDRSDLWVELSETE